MTLTRPWAIDAAFPNAADQRKQLAAIYTREGVFPDPTTVAAAGIAFAGTGWGISARAFGAVLKRGGAPFSQSYGSALVSNDGVVANAWTIGAAPASGSRKDLLCIRARDTTQGDSASGTPNDGPAGANRSGIPEFVVAAGVAGTPGVRPAVPAGYEEIAEVTTPSGAASAAGSTIVPTYAFAQVVGAPIYVRTSTDVANLLGMVTGDVAIALDTGYAWRYNGTRWGRYGQKIAGTEGSYGQGGGLLSPNAVSDALTWAMPVPLLRGGILRIFMSCYLYGPANANYAGNLRFIVGATTVADRRFHSQGRAGVLMPSALVEYKIPADITAAGNVILRVTSDAASAGPMELFNIQGSVVYDYLGE